MDAVAGVLDEHPESEDELRKAIPNLTDQDLLEARYGKDGHGPVKVEGAEHFAATRTAGLDQHWLFCSDLPRAAFHFVMKTSPDGRAAYYTTSSEIDGPMELRSTYSCINGFGTTRNNNLSSRAKELSTSRRSPTMRCVYPTVPKHRRQERGNHCCGPGTVGFHLSHCLRGVGPNPKRGPYWNTSDPCERLELGPAAGYDHDGTETGRRKANACRYRKQER